MLNWSAPPRNAPVVSLSETAGAVDGLVVVLRGGWSEPRGRVACSLRTAAIMFLTAVYDTARRLPLSAVRRWQASSRIGLLPCLPIDSTFLQDWYAWAGMAFAAMSSSMTLRVAGPVLLASR